jgi:hypothetical protein
MSTLMHIEKSLARTYANPSYDDPYEAVKEYKRVQRASTDHPNKKSAALSNIVELPRGRIRPWVDGDGMPDSARAVLTARSKHWINFESKSEIARALAELAGHITGGGSITAETYVPAISEGRRVSCTDISTVFESVGVQTTCRNTNSESRSVEVIPADNASILGRTLVAWGLPIGETKPTELPELLKHVDSTAHEKFVRAYILHRGTNLPQKATSTCQSEYPKSFHTAFAELAREVTGERITASENVVTISAAAMRDLSIDEN